MSNFLEIINSDPNLKDNYLLLNFDSIDWNRHTHVFKILVNPNFKELLIEKLKKSGPHLIEHPLGKKAGYRMLYQIKSPVLFEYEKSYCEIWEQVCCLSFFQKCWLPLDKLINNTIWNEVQKCDYCLIPSEVNRLVYNITNSFFTEKSFKQTIKDYLEKSTSILVSEEAQQKLDREFFAFTPTLIELIKDGKFDELIIAYKSFVCY